MPHLQAGSSPAVIPVQEEDTAECRRMPRNSRVRVAEAGGRTFQDSPGASSPCWCVGRQGERGIVRTWSHGQGSAPWAPPTVTLRTTARPALFQNAGHSQEGFYFRTE